MTDLFDTLFYKTNSISIEEIFSKDEDKSFYNDHLNLKDPSRLNEKNDSMFYTLDSKLFINYNGAINENDMRCDINDDDLYYTNPKNVRIFPVTNNEEKEKEIETNKCKTNITNRNDFETQKKKKDKAKLGRKRKGEINDNQKVHSKESIDNIKIKFKRLFFNNLNAFLNNKLKKSKNLKLNSLRFKKLNSGYIERLKKNVNLEMLDSPASAVLSRDIAKKYKNFDRDHNKKIINLIYEENEESLMSILNKSIGQLMKIFCSSKEDKKEEDLFKEYKRLDEYIKIFIKNLPENGKDKEDYFNKLKNEGENFEKGLKSIFGRNRKIGSSSN